MGLGERSAVSVFPRALCASRRTVLVERERERENTFKRKKKIQNGNQRGNGKREITKKTTRKRRTKDGSFVAFF